MPIENIIGIVDEALLKQLNPTYQSEGNKEPEATVWVQVNINLPSIAQSLGRSTKEMLEAETRMNEKFLEILKRPWSEELNVNGVASKIIPTIISKQLHDLIVQHWDELPMFTKNFLWNLKGEAGKKKVLLGE